MAERPSEHDADLDRLRERIISGEAYVALRHRRGQPIDRSLAHLARLRAALADLERAPAMTSPPPSHPSPSVPPVPSSPGQPADDPPRRWGTRHCPACGAACHGLWLDGSTVWCGPCATARRRQRAANEAKERPTSVV